MKKEKRTIVYDQELHIEAYQLEGYIHPFPLHYHDYYVIGYMEAGERCMSCCNEDSIVHKGDVILFNPEDTHGCRPHRGLPMDYRSINIPKEVMLRLSEEITGTQSLPRFTLHHVQDEDVVCYVKPLFEMIMEESKEFEKEEYLYLLVSLLIRKYSCPFAEHLPERKQEIEDACTYMQEHYMEQITLDQLVAIAHLSKSSLLRYFTKCKGVTPYRYLEMIRIKEAKKLLEQGISSMDAAMQTGFSDQSHFTNYFSRFIGLPPGVYREIFKKKTQEEAYEDTK